MLLDVLKYLLALVITTMFGGVIAILLLHPPTLSEGTTALVNVAFGILASGTGLAWGYYFGSSSSSQKKDDTISNALVASGTGSGAAAETVSVTTAHPGTVTATGSTSPPPASGPALVRPPQS
jgi:hypothetical protein